MRRIMGLWKKEATYRPPDFLSSKARDILSKMLDADPGHRMKVHDVMQVGGGQGKDQNRSHPLLTTTYLATRSPSGPLPAC